MDFTIFVQAGLHDNNALDLYVLGAWARLCGLVVRVPGYRSRGPGFDSRHYQIFRGVVGLEWRPLGLVRIIEELLERTVAAPV
jgi:hypothetical protein